ncbi:hypothetical protein RCG19_04085 [Neobacillus sp. OS1-2]|uniref:hypothetical protein n=1 Tax=Neobacillus sp. OS1-2 TaxID=3070680 RepID=UPI0027DFC879|nr:hypothetical protein [Neobacillus sp. OS1-2]WML40875.1 hypothetical protein RCG19_04085 [Neobacillus sp. OS1-2]
MIIFMLSILLLSACNNASFKDESKATIKTVKKTFTEKVNKPNKRSGKIHFYLPSGYSIKDQSSNNIILQKGSDTYILFVNPQEDSSSKVVYQSTIEQYKKLDMNETLTNKENKFGFLTIKQLKDGLNEVTIGVGGAKITTQINTSDMNEDSKTMMQIVNSVEYPTETKE